MDAWNDGWIDRQKDRETNRARRGWLQAEEYNRIGGTFSKLSTAQRHSRQSTGDNGLNTPK